MHWKFARLIFHATGQRVKLHQSAEMRVHICIHVRNCTVGAKVLRCTGIRKIVCFAKVFCEHASEIICCNSGQSLSFVAIVDTLCCGDNKVVGAIASLNIEQ